ncbi:zinc finger protein 501-like isoform X1 [Toxorhynchites rutilus septentrionalis]|uniref:zinc finger protein 501-like isoform X1 n=2 Tax=Toxorhynchites rutilus septentrionalis TaxID=329112 RepID=UPI002479C988|nr:zinc finger protein 501-like isoform X1 [Toxorhynchites rutilus septentrionalis]
MAIVTNNLDQCSFCSDICNREFHYALVPSRHEEKKLNFILQKLNNFTSQLSSYPTCDKCRQEFMTVHNIPESCFQNLPSTEPYVIKMDPELLIDDHEQPDNENSRIAETDSTAGFRPVEREANMQIKGENGEVFFINEMDADEGLMEDHKRLHTKKEPLKCEMCEKTFVSKYRLEKHVRTHTGERPYSCPYCPKASKDRSALILHIRTHTGERPYPCPHCPKAFINSSALHEHIRIHTDERPYSCPHCPKAFKHQPSLKMHIRTHTGERPYSCSDCPWTFTNPSALQDHMRTHKDERPYSCPHCPKAFKSLRSLQPHIRTHTDELPFSCPHCPKSCRTQSALKRHIRIHTGERPYSCPKCPKAFKNSSAVKQHIRIHSSSCIRAVSTTCSIKIQSAEPQVTVKEEMTGCKVISPSLKAAHK